MREGAGLGGGGSSGGRWYSRIAAFACGSSSLGLESLLAKGADHLVGQKAEDVDNFVVRISLHIRSEAVSPGRKSCSD
jgi:hypothetical protein